MIYHFLETDIFQKIKNFYTLKKILQTQRCLKMQLKNKIDIVIHLACISNDPTYELNSELSKKINYDCFEDLVKISKKIM